MAFKIFSIIFTVLFWWIIWPYKALRKLNFERDRDMAVVECKTLAIQNQKRHYVVQNGMHFHVQNRASFRRWNLKNKKKIQSFDYRNALVYHCDANGKGFYYERNFVRK